METHEEPLVQGRFLLEKFPGKGGWTYALLPQVPPDGRAPFGWRVVNGHIDGQPLRQYRLMPMGNGQLFLPVKAALRKAIGKQAGDWVEVLLHAHRAPEELTEELRGCFGLEPKARYEAFLALPDEERRARLAWIYEAKDDEERVRRIVRFMDGLS